MIREMANHEISIPDRLRGRELRSIVWDDEAGTVGGDHFSVAWLRAVFEAPKPITVGDAGRTWDLADPAHDPAEFLVLLHLVFWPALDEPLRSGLPSVFDGLNMPLGDPGERLYGVDGNGDLVEFTATA